MKNAEKTTLTRFAEKIVNRRMSVLAIFLLESTKHISFISGQALIFFGPILTLFVNDKEYYNFINLLEDRKNIEFLISEIEYLNLKTK